VGILRVHTKTFPLADDVDLHTVARGTPGFAGADLANLVNEAALMAARRDKKKVEAEDFEYAKDKIMMGLERKSLMLTDEEKVVTAYHEAGHAVVAAFLPGTDPLHKVTIIPRGRALGLTVQLPTEDRYTYKQKFIEHRIAVLMGGRVAEELTQQDVTTGAGSDIVRATKMARQMVCEWGMSELGPLALGGPEEPVFLGRQFAQRSEYGEVTATKIDEEVSRIVSLGHETAKRILNEYREVLERLAHDLLERESVEGREVYEMIEEVTGRDMMPESMKKPAEPEASAEPPKDSGKPARARGEKSQEPGLAGGSLPSPATP
jgi:cell division protease FtsH